MCIGGKLGAELNTAELLKDASLNELQVLFGETCGCFVIEVAPESERAVKALVGSTPLVKIGAVSEKSALAVLSKSSSVYIPFEELRKAYTTARF